MMQIKIRFNAFGAASDLSVTQINFYLMKKNNYNE